MSSQHLTYDDRNSAFQYTGSWFLDGTWSASNGQSGTLSGTNDLSGYLKFTFPTPAVSFTFYGMKRSHGGLFGVCVDCNINSPSFTTIDAFDATDNGQNPPVALYSQSFSQPAIHTVLIKNEADSRGTPSGNSQLTVDRIVLDVPIQPTTTTSTTPALAPTPKAQPTSTSSTTTTSREGTTSTSSSSSSSAPTSATSSTSSGSADRSTSSSAVPGALTDTLSAQTPSSSSSSGVPLSANEPGSSGSGKSSSNLGVIIGAVVGSLAVIGLILLIVFCLRRRRRNKTATINKSLAKANPVPRSPLPMSTVEPFVVSSGTEASSSPTSGGDDSVTMPVSNSPTSKVSANSMEKRRSLYHRRLPSISQASTSAAQSSLYPPSTAGTQGRERDAGPLSFYTVDEDLPPEYSQLYSS